MPANIEKKAGREDALLVDRHPLAACAAVDDTGMEKKRSGGVGKERGLGDCELYFSLFFLESSFPSPPSPTLLVIDLYIGHFLSPPLLLLVLV